MRVLFKTEWQTSLAWVLNLFTAVILIWSSYRGLDFSDESYYYLNYYYHTGPLHPLSFFTQIYNTFFGWASLHIVAIRLLHIVLVMAASILLAYAFIPVFLRIGMPLRSNEVGIFFQLAATGAFGTMAWGPLTLSYNSFSTIFVCLLVALWLLLQFRQWTVLWPFFTLQAIFGFLSCLAILNKAPNIMVLIPLLCISACRLVGRKERSLGRAISSAVVFLSGFYLALPMILKTWHPGSFFDFFGRILSAANGSGHGFPMLLNHYLDYFMKELSPIWPYLLTAAVIMLLPALMERISGKEYRRSPFLIVSLCPLIALIVLREYYLGGMPFRNSLYEVYTISFVYLMAATALFKIKHRRRIWMVSMALFVIPLLGAVGTSNSLSAQSVFYLPFVLLAIFLLVYSMPCRRFVSTGLLMLMLLVNVQVVSGIVQYPYRICSSLTEHRATTGAAAISGLFLTEDQLALRRRLQFVREAPQTHLFVFSHQLGLCLLLEKRPFGDAWIAADEGADMDQFADNCKGIDQRDIIFAVPEGRPMPAEVDAFLREHGIRFPEDYRRVDAIRWQECYTGKTFNIGIYYPENEE